MPLLGGASTEIANMAKTSTNPLPDDPVNYGANGALSGVNYVVGSVLVSGARFNEGRKVYANGPTTEGAASVFQDAMGTRPMTHAPRQGAGGDRTMQPIGTRHPPATNVANQ
jgi:hypothetical protein